jgi:hypothetical protein
VATDGAAAYEEVGPLVVHGLRAATLVVGERDDPVRAARRVARLAFGAPVAGGYFAAAVGAVWVHPRRLSAFHAALLSALEGADGRAARSSMPPVPCGTVPPLRSQHEAVLRLGLDEGATLIHTASAPSFEGRRPQPVRAVFTNVDPLSRLQRELTPAGVLRILRVAAPRTAEEGGGPRSPVISASP